MGFVHILFIDDEMVHTYSDELFYQLMNDYDVKGFATITGIKMSLSNTISATKFIRKDIVVNDEHSWRH